MSAAKQSFIINSFLDTDAYKLHMQQAAFHQNPQVLAAYEFTCRNKDDHLGIYASAIQEQVNHMADVVLSSEEYDYLATFPHFKKDYLDYLRQYRYNPQQVHISVVHPVLPSTEKNEFGEDHSDLVITIDGPWLETILWEIPLLAIISEVVQRHRRPNVGVPEALATLKEKLDELFANHSEEALASFKVTDFGTRRRYSQAVQEAVVVALHKDPRFSKHLVGTSNYDIARRLGLVGVGTQAHEWFQAFQQLCPELRFSQTMALTMWLQEYPDVLGIALTDCITMDAFLKDFNHELANTYHGLRHDSGDPIEWAEKALKHYERLGIDPKSKVLVFSDGLSLEKGARLYNTFKDRTTVMCGIGTQLTCSINGVRPMNIVIKMVRCQGKPVAKISDSPGKSQCDDKEFLARLFKTFGVSLSPPPQIA